MIIVTTYNLPIIADMTVKNQLHIYFQLLFWFQIQNWKSVSFSVLLWTVTLYIETLSSAEYVTKFDIYQLKIAHSLPTFN